MYGKHFQLDVEADISKFVTFVFLIFNACFYVVQLHTFLQ